MIQQLFTERFFLSDINDNKRQNSNRGEKSSIYKRVILFAIIILSFSQFASATVYTSIADGNWSDPSIWSTDGITPCACIPNDPLNNDEVYIDSKVTLDVDVTLDNGSFLKVNYITGKLIGGTNSLFVTDGTVLFNGQADLNSMYIAANGVVNIVAYSGVSIANANDVFGVLNVDGGYFTCANGNFKIRATGQLLLNNYSKIEISAGNFTNDGYVYIDATCCLESDGKWTNSNTGTIEGSGSTRTISGNMTNNGTWDPNIVWCSSGADFNMPSPENCVDANDVCGQLVLGVTFDEFNVFLKGREVEISWSVLSQENNDFFIVQRSKDGYSFEDIGTVEGDGTTQQKIWYSFIDGQPYTGVSYYRLMQIDFDGESSFTTTKSIKVGSEFESVISTCNLFGQIVDHSYKGVVIDTFEDGTTRKRYQY